MKQAFARVTSIQRPLIGMAGLLVVLTLIGQVGGIMRRRPASNTVVRSLASICRREYQTAHTVTDSSAVDARVYDIHDEWRHVPSCGELRLSGRL